MGGELNFPAFRLPFTGGEKTHYVIVLQQND